MIKMAAALIMVLTAYTNCDPGMRCDGVMASGVQTFDGAVACGSAFEFGTRFCVPALGRCFICQDRGSAIGDNRLDIWMADRSQALEFGRQELEAILPWGRPDSRNKEELWTNYTRLF